MTDTEDAFTLDPTLRAMLMEASSATVSIQLLKRGLRFAAIGGVRPLNPLACRFVGPAYTLRFIPAREDLATPASIAQGDNPQRVAIEAIPPDAVLVIDAQRETRAGTLGDILVARLMARGVAGVVSDGAMRDVGELEKMALPIFCNGVAAPRRPASTRPMTRRAPPISAGSRRAGRTRCDRTRCDPTRCEAPPPR